MLPGVLDIGSNSAQLQVVEARPGAPPLPTHAVKEPILLGQAFGPDGSIEEAGIERVVTAVDRAMDAARRLGVQQLYVFTTSAVRDAANRDQILDRVEAEAGVRPQFLSGHDEARLTYLAVHQWYGWPAGRLLIIGIGGGPAEIVLGRDAEPDLAVSLPLGAGRLTRAFLPDDPPSREQLTALRRHVNGTLREVADRLRWEGAPDRAIGTSKTFKQLARLAGAPAQPNGPFARRSVSAADLDAWIPRLARLRAHQRAKLRGVPRPRGQQIIAGAIVARAAMKAVNVRAVDICPWALREGIILHYLQTTLNETFVLPLRPLTGTGSAKDQPGSRRDTASRWSPHPPKRPDTRSSRPGGDRPPIYFNNAYFLGADGEETGKTYVPLRDAMGSSGKAAIASFVMRSKEYLAAARADSDLLVRETLFFADKVRDPHQQISNLPGRVKLSPQERSMPRQLIDAMTGSWRPSDYRDADVDTADEAGGQQRDQGPGQLVVALGDEPVEGAFHLGLPGPAQASGSARLSRWGGRLAVQTR